MGDGDADDVDDDRGDANGGGRAADEAASQDTADTEAGLIGDVAANNLHDDATLSLTPEQHQRLKDGLHGARFDDIRRASRRYLVVGSGSGESGRRRQRVCAQLDDRRDAVAFRLEEFGFDADDLDQWAPAFEVLSAQATWIVGVIEDFNGGHVWELGYLYRQQTGVRDVLWLLKRVYDDPETQRAQYENGMAASHLAALEAVVGDRVVEWATLDELESAVEQIP
ncbi:aminopeptidase [Halorubrum sp. SD690R]|uniref:aminopeptidase n=1 Tax=Halorubrum sp. SD690R TaxID=2518117 RepID=UPI0010F64A6C|nr:aminopeptidase [Halorubrum sp. SD690R]TKX48491.1 aminopeptidase [Halorubrum sp. SD690R]